MIIAITGHTKGIGLAITTLLNKNNTIIGLSRSNGYNLEDITPIIDAVRHADVFINNAYHKYQQCNILKQLANEWQGTNKQIINIGSTCVNYPRTELELDNDPWEYRDHKTALQKLFRKLVKENNACTINLINPGGVNTDMIKHLSGPKLTTQEVANAVKFIIDNKKIKELTLWQ
jgi:NAD(P)-dependent dehydrogenase (short-subunit alcohol dehydrogenase family)